MVWTSVVDGFSKKAGSRKVSSKRMEKLGDILHLSEALLDSLDDAIAVVNGEGRIAGVNAAWQELQKKFSWLGNVKKGGSVIDYAALEQASKETGKVLPGMQSVLQGSQAEFRHAVAVFQEGKPFWLRLKAKALPDGFALVSLRDVTARCKAEQDLRESHSLFQRIVEGIGDGVFIYDLAGRFLMHNSVCTDLFSLDSKPLIGKSIEEVFPPHLAQNILSQNQLVLGTGRSIGYELTLESPHGKRNLLVQKGIYRNFRNEAVGVLGISRDITERKRAEEKLEKSERYFRALIEKSNDCILLVSEKGRITYASPQATEITGYAIEELTGTDGFFWIHPEDIPLTIKKIQLLHP